MTERITYAEEYVGECTSGSCDLPATVRVYEDFMLCAHHHLRYEVGQEIDEASVALGLIPGWQSIATMHGNELLLRMFENAEEEAWVLKDRAERRQKQLDRIAYEAEHGQELRVRMGGQAKASEQEEAGALPELSAFGRQIVALTGYLGKDLTRLARDMVWQAGYSERSDVSDAEEMVEMVEARMRSADATPLPDDFLLKLAGGLGLTELGRKGLAMAYTFDEYLKDEGEPEHGSAASA